MLQLFLLYCKKTKATPIYRTLTAPGLACPPPPHLSRLILSFVVTWVSGGEEGGTAAMHIIHNAPPWVGASLLYACHLL